MHAVILFPVVDLRTIASSSSALLRRRPAWPTGIVAPAPGQYGEFLTGFGPLRAALPSESDGWAGRRQYVPARSIRLPADFPHSAALGTSRRRPAKCLSRRLYGSRNSPRMFLEVRVDFSPRGSWRVPALDPEAGWMPRATLPDLEFRVPTGESAELSSFGNRLAAFVARSTSNRLGDGLFELVVPGQTQIVMSGPSAAYDDSWISLLEYEPQLAGVYFKRSGSLDLWYIDRDVIPNDRRYVLLLTRLHVERVSLASTVELLPMATRSLKEAGQAIDWPRLCDHLGTTARYLAQDHTYGLDVSPLRALISAERILLGSDWEAAIDVLTPHCASAVSALERIVNIERVVNVMGDQYNTQGQVGAVGPNAHVHHVNFVQAWQDVASSLDLAQLAEELKEVRAAARSRADTPEEDAAIAALAQAQLAAEQGQGEQCLGHLARAGRWALTVAQSIGVGVAAGAIKTALGL